MKKICTKCNRTVEGIEANGKFCSQCGTELTELPVSSTPSGVSINEDNRIDKSVHTGDNIKVGGDNAQTINKQQVSTTNITNIQQIQQDETKKIVNCAISGKAVLLIKTANCPKCHRCVSQEYYIDSKRMCTDCYEKQYGHAYDPLSSTPTTIRPTTSSNSYRQQAKTEGVGTLMGNGTRPTPPATPTPGTSVSNNSSTSPILYIAIAAAIGVGGYFLFSNKGSEKTDIPTKPVTEQIVSESTPTNNETTNKQSKRQNKTTSSVKHSQATITPKVKEESQPKKTSSYAAEPSTARESVPVQPKLQTAGDYYSAAKSAYNRGNYTQAVSQFQEAAAKGDVASYYCLSTIYREGNGVGKSVNTAFQYMLKAAQGGYVAAYYELAEMYRGGRGTEKNIPQARVWYQKVIDTGGKNADRAKRALDNCN